MTPSLAVLAAALIAASHPASTGAQTPKGAASQTLKAPVVRPAIDGILAAFEMHPLVGLSDWHGLAQELDFYAALIRDPRFARDVGNVVVEFGGAAHQDIIDRYVGGEDVPYTELRTVWTDTVGWIPAPLNLGYMNVFAQVRTINLTLPPAQRIRVWLGEPPIDWSKIKTQAELFAVIETRDSHAATVIVQNILAKNKKALVIYGGAHFRRDAANPGRPTSQSSFVDLIDRVEAKYPGTVFVVSPYIGYVEPACSKAFERKVKAWPIPALAAPVRGSTLERDLRRSDCHFVQPATAPPNPTSEQLAARAKAQADVEDQVAGVNTEATLYLGPAISLTVSPLHPDIYLDIDYRREMDRRNQIMIGTPLPVDPQIQGFSVGAPRKLRP